MFLHSGAAFHGHEYSPPSQRRAFADSTLRSNHAPRRTPLKRSSFSTPNPPKATIYENPLPILSQSARPLSERLPRTTEPTVRFRDLDMMSEDGRSIANSDSSDVTAGGRRKRRPARTSTTFHLALPPPTLTQKQRLLEIRPKLLLQLQRLSTDSRPMPEVDVLPSTLVVPRLAKKFPRMLKGKGALGRNDVLVVRSEEYRLQDNFMENSDSEEESIANRDLIAVICQMRKDSTGSSGKAEIVLSDGAIWISTPLPNGTYESVSVDDNGHQTVARWVKRSNKRYSVDETTGGAESKFTFSIIDPNSRRHPILATMTQYKLDIPNTYISVSPSTAPPTSPTKGENTSLAEEASDPRVRIIDEKTRRLIQVTGVWLALREGWSPYFQYNDAQAASISRVRSMSLTPEACRPVNASTPEHINSPLGVLGNKMRLVSADRTPKRSMSAGTAFMQREKARRLGHPPSTVASDSEGEMPLTLKAVADTTVGFDSTPTPPISLSPPGSGASTPETPTHHPRRAQSAYLPPNILQNLTLNNRPQRHSMMDMKGKQVVSKAKVGRWKSFTNFFRRSKNSD